MSHVRAIQWLCDSADDSADDTDDDDIKLPGKLLSTPELSTSSSASDDASSPIVLVCIYCWVILLADSYPAW